MEALLKISNCQKHFDGIFALYDFSCEVFSNEIIGLIGPNGAGKSTLFNIITGFLYPDSGSVQFGERIITKMKPSRINRYGISRTFQDLRLIRQMTVMDNILLSFHNQPGELLHNVFFNYKKTRVIESENRQKAEKLLDYAGISEKAGELADNLSYGQQKLLSLICCLTSEAKLLLLDEPIAGINPQMIEKILAIITDLHKNGKTIILIEHNMDAIFQVCQRVIFMDAGKKVSEGTPEEVRNDPQVIEAYLD